jgi:hypothetical protein
VDGEAIEAMTPRGAICEDSSDRSDSSPEGWRDGVTGVTLSTINEPE